MLNPEKLHLYGLLICGAMSIAFLTSLFSVTDQPGWNVAALQGAAGFGISALFFYMAITAESGNGRLFGVLQVLTRWAALLLMLFAIGQAIANFDILVYGSKRASLFGFMASPEVLEAAQK